MKLLIIPLLFVAMNATADSDAIKTSTAIYAVPYGEFHIGVIEWIPNDNPNVRCVFAGLKSQYSGLSCYNLPKPKSEPIWPER